MKSNLVLLFLFVATLFSNAQQSDCSANLILFKEAIENKDYAKATDYWTDFKIKCPKFDERIYLLGQEVLSYNVAVADSKTKAVKELLNLYDLYDINFPLNKNGNHQKRALLLYDTKQGTDAEIYNFLDKAFTKDLDLFDDPQAIYLYFEQFHRHAKDPKKAISKEQLLEKYFAIQQLVAKLAVQNPSKSTEYHNVTVATTTLISDLLVCERLVPFFKKNYEKHKTDKLWLTNAATVLSDKCKTNPFFETVVMALHTQFPSSKSATYLGLYYLNAKKQDLALSYYQNAIDLSVDKNEKAVTAYSVASIVATSDQPLAEKMIALAIENCPTDAKNYVFLANLYANSVSECATTDAERKAIYQLAATTVVKAIGLSSHLDPVVRKMEADYLKSAIPSSDLIGKTIRIGCWINETVQF